MEIGNKILELRKKKGLSQEELAEMIGVARQTISKWELGETSPDIKQSKELSKIFNVSLDELVDNDTKNIIIEKVNNTEKLAGLIIKILKFIGIVFLVLLIIDVISFIIFTFNKDSKVAKSVSEVEMMCTLNKQDYIIEVGSDGYFNCSNCSKELQKDLKDKYIDFSDINKNTTNIFPYFENNNGYCE